MLLTAGLRRAASSSAQVPPMLVSNVDDRIAVGDADDGLGRQMEHRVDLVLAERAFEQHLIAHIAAHDAHPPVETEFDKAGARHPVAHERNDIGAKLRPGVRPASRRPDRCRR